MARGVFTVKLSKAERDTLERIAKRNRRTAGDMWRVIFEDYCARIGEPIEETTETARAEQRRLEGFGK